MFPRLFVGRDRVRLVQILLLDEAADDHQHLG
jgi:hypothetical protein